MTCKDGRFNTGNDLCSNDLRDTSDNTAIIDGYVNSKEYEVEDRFGTPRLTLAGIEKKVDDRADDAIGRFEGEIDAIIKEAGGVEVVSEFGDSQDRAASQFLATELMNSNMYIEALLIGIKEGKDNAKHNSSIMKTLSSCTVSFSKGDWYVESNLDIPDSVSLVSDTPVKLNFLTHTRTRRGGSSGSINVKERYTQFAYFDKANLKFYVNDVLDEDIVWLNDTTLEARGTLTTDTVKFVIKDASVMVNQFNNLSNVNISSKSFNYNASRDNVAYGNYTLRHADTITNSTAIGSKALMTSKGSTNNTAVGFQTLYRNQGHHNTAVGSIAGEWLESGNDHTLVGTGAGGKWRAGTGSVALGWHAGWDLHTPNYCVAVGYRANASTGYVTAIGNTAVGAYAMDFNSGKDNVAVGYRSLNCQYSGSTHVTTRSESNVSIGASSMRKHQEGDNNVTIGTFASGDNKRRTDRNVIIGGSALYSGGTGNTEKSVYIGYLAGRNGSGVDNVAIGRDALKSANSNLNTAVGAGAFIGLASGSYNTALGREAGLLRTDGSSVGELKNSTLLGANTRVSGDNQVQLGDASTTTYVYGTVQNRSDARDKADIKELDLGLDFVMKLKPSEYRWNYREWEGKAQGKRKHAGFIAQDVLKAVDSSEYAFVQDHSVNGGSDVLSIGYDEFIPVLTKAIQEQQKLIEELRDEVKALKMLQ